MNTFNKKTVEDIDVRGKKVLVRCDFNVPIKNGAIADDTRIKESLKTIRYLVGNNARVILCSHLGRPDGAANPEYSLKPVAIRLSELLKTDVKLSADVAGEKTKALVNGMKDGDVILIENLRFKSEEEENSLDFAKQLASLADIYVNDAFGTAHRAHASTSGVAAFLPSVAGYLMESEIKVMGQAVSNPDKPLVVVLGGVKISDKMKLIRNFFNIADTVLIGGAMSYTFFKSMGYYVGLSTYEENMTGLAQELLKEAKEKGVGLHLPADLVATPEFKDHGETRIVPCDQIPEGWMSLDIGPKTRELYADIIKSAGTVIWNGSLGVAEMDNFRDGTIGIIKALAESPAVTIVGGGDSIAVLTKTGLKDKMTHVSTGGGASMEFLEGRVLPGIAALNDK